VNPACSEHFWLHPFAINGLGCVRSAYQFLTEQLSKDSTSMLLVIITQLKDRSFASNDYFL